MNNQRLEKKVLQDAAKLKKDMDNLVNDSAALYRRFEVNLGQNTSKAKEDLTSWVDDSVNQFGKGVEKIAGEAKVTVADASATVLKDVKRGLSQYNTKAQKVADQVPGGIGKKVTKYPWVAVSIALSFGLLLGVLLNPVRRPAPMQI